MSVFSNVIKPQGLEPLQFPTKFRSHSSNEYGEVIHNNEQIRSDLVALLEIGAQCAGHMHTLSEGRGESEQERFIHDEKERLRRLLTA